MEPSDAVRHTCPQCGDLLIGHSEDEVVQMVVEHAKSFHGTEIFDLLSPEELRRAIRSEYENYWAHVEHLLPADRLQTVFEAKLNAREREVLVCVVHGLSNKEIAKKLLISPRTASTHLQHIYEKLDVHSRAALVAMVRAADRAIEARFRSPKVPGPFVEG